MKKNIVNRFLAVAFLLVSFLSCDLIETAEQDVSPIGTTEKSPTATFTQSPAGTTFKEGQTLIYTIKTDKMIDRSVTFLVKQIGGTAGEDDYVAEPAVLQPYSTEAQVKIEFLKDDYPESEETLKLEIGVYSLADKYLLSPATTNPTTLDLKVANTNDPAKLTIVMEWAGDDDYDMVTWSDTPDYPHTEWGDSGASANNPETDKSIWLADPPGTYYVNIMDWDGPAFNYTFRIGHPDGTVQVIQGTFDRSKTNYVNDLWTAWGDEYDSFRVLKVVHNGNSFTVTKL